MDNNFTVNAAIIAAIAAIIAPTISSLIHSIKEYRISKMQCTVEARLQLYESFTNAYSKCQYGPEKTGYMQNFYHETTKLIVLCHKSSTRRCLFKLANRVKAQGASENTDILYEKCVSLLTKEF